MAIYYCGYCCGGHAAVSYPPPCNQPVDLNPVPLINVLSLHDRILAEHEYPRSSQLNSGRLNPNPPEAPLFSSSRPLTRKRKKSPKFPFPKKKIIVTRFYRPSPPCFFFSARSPFTQVQEPAAVKPIKSLIPAPGSIPSVFLTPSWLPLNSSPRTRICWTCSGVCLFLQTILSQQSIISSLLLHHRARPRDGPDLHQLYSSAIARVDLALHEFIPDCRILTRPCKERKFYTILILF